MEISAPTKKVKDSAKSDNLCLTIRDKVTPMNYQADAPTLSTLEEQLAEIEMPIILLEGTRQVPEEDGPYLSAVATLLARYFPHARFRSGNADGSDTLFARGVEAVDATRMEVVTPTPGHRKTNLHPENHVFPLNMVSALHEQALAYASNEATPKNRSLIDKRNEVPRLGAKARYLLRDTLKVLGDPDHNLPRADVGIFYTKPDPMDGGTGHTIRVCMQESVPVYLFTQWRRWL